MNKFILFPAIIAGFVSWVKAVWMPFLIGLPVYFPVVSLLIYISYSNNRLFVD